MRDLEKKLKIERIEKCVNCKWFVECREIGEYEECVNYREVDFERMYVIVKLSEWYRKELEDDLNGNK